MLELLLFCSVLLVLQGRSDLIGGVFPELANEWVATAQGIEGGRRMPQGGRRG